jgi:hypothetical protein
VGRVGRLGPWDEGRRAVVLTLCVRTSNLVLPRYRAQLLDAYKLVVVVVVVVSVVEDVPSQVVSTETQSATGRSFERRPASSLGIPVHIDTGQILQDASLVAGMQPSQLIPDALG